MHGSEIFQQNGMGINMQNLDFMKIVTSSLQIHGPMWQANIELYHTEGPFDKIRLNVSFRATFHW